MIFEPAYVPALAIAGAGAIIDIRQRKLPNIVCLALALSAGAALGFTFGLSALPGALLHASFALVCGMILFRFGLIGGGDAKFYAAAACGVPLVEGVRLLGWTSAAGLLLLAALAALRLLSGKSLSAMRGYSVPYGVAIFFGFTATQLR